MMTKVDSTVFALAWSTLNPSYLWTDQTFDNYAKLLDGLAMDRYFGRITGRPW